MKTQMNLQFNLDHDTAECEMQDEDAVHLESRMQEFREDPEKMQELNDFLDELLHKAQTEVDRKSATKRGDKDKFREGLALLNNIKRGRIVTRARGFAVRLIDALCNCTNTNPVSTPVTAAVTRPATS